MDQMTVLHQYNGGCSEWFGESRLTDVLLRQGIGCSDSMGCSRDYPYGDREHHSRTFPCLKLTVNL